MKKEEPDTSSTKNEAFMPKRLSHLRQTSMKEKAAGVSAVLSALEQLLQYVSPADAWKTVFSMNQKGGFLCPGFAWPDPDDNRSSLGEYCENFLPRKLRRAVQESLVLNEIFGGKRIAQDSYLL